MGRTPLAILIILLILHDFSVSKLIQKYLKILEFKQSSGWFYVGKIALSEGQVDIKLTTEKLKGDNKEKNPYLYLNMVPDQNWESLKEKKCTDYDSSLFKVHDHELLLSGEISISQITIPIHKQELFYFIICDCKKELINDNSFLDLEIKVNLEIINNGRYMGEEEDHWLIVPVIIAIGTWIFTSDKHFLDNNAQSDPDYAKLIIFGAISSNISSLIWRSFGYLIYRNFGVNYFFFHFIYLFMHSISETTTLGLLILISMGWSLNFMSGPKLNKSFPLLSFFVLLNVTFTLLTQLPNSNHDMYHTFDAAFGSAIIMLRFLIVLSFIISTTITYNQSRFRVRQFLKKFGFLGALYITLIPIIILLANRFIPTKDRNQFVFISVQSTKTICNISLMYMVSSRRSEYNKLSYKNASFMPSQTGLF